MKNLNRVIISFDTREKVHLLIDDGHIMTYLT